ncbi:D-alanyl-D-alanine carboxypeptidase family protein [Halobacillus yeomjeoni]|uniref:D-alanyl-D-alanine carboxypeptidase n=1 Tax=Halobacillus yeomjeoni TaxID=311194 RepID=A0A931HTU7_9BACI|nr:D-alanyl-D-alanine carboxypeptidase family protein [Halobacillus yeomjeoni]MBH0229640.1 D-alanyl-D-alanine carboxypeptidase [Halobacillus yeomjeoni]
MRKSLCIFLVIILLLPIGWTQQVGANPGISVSAAHAVLMDAASGRVLYEKEAYHSTLIASTTKIMTAIIAIESGKLDEKAKVSRRAVYTEGSSIYLTEKEKIPLKDLVYGLMLRSGNDSAVAIAEHVGGSVEGFTQLMNEKAAWLGMNDSHFENPHGLDGETHYSSAYDLALLMAYSMKNKTFREVTGAEKYRSENRDYAWGNKNKLLTRYYEPTNGGKTGFTKKAGRTLVSSAEKGGMELIAVTLNAPDDWNDHMQMYEWGFKNFESVKLQSEGTLKVNGEKFYLPRDIYYPLTLNERESLKASFYRSSENSDIAGITQYMIGQQPVLETPVWSERPKFSIFTDIKRFMGRLMGVAPWST